MYACSYRYTILLCGNAVEFWNIISQRSFIVILAHSSPILSETGRQNISIWVRLRTKSQKKQEWIGLFRWIKLEIINATCLNMHCENLERIGYSQQRKGKCLCNIIMLIVSVIPLLTPLLLWISPVKPYKHRPSLLPPIEYFC